MSVISIQKLTKQYPTGRGVVDISLKVEKGELYGFIGPNGAGKSTTIKLLLNFIFPTGGSAQIMGMDCAAESDKIKRKTGYVPGEVRYYGNMTALSLLKSTLAFHGRRDTEELDRLCSLFEVEKNKRLSELSLGNKKKIALVSALLCDPELVILDEPTNGLDPLMQKRLFEELKARTQKGVTVFLSSHVLTEVQEYCSKVAFIKEGKIIEIQELAGEVEPAKILTVFGAADLEQFYRLGAKKLEATKEKTVLYCSGNLHQMAKAIYESGAENFTVENPSLESRFLSYYEGGEQK